MLCMDKFDSCWVRMPLPSAGDPPRGSHQPIDLSLLRPARSPWWERRRTTFPPSASPRPAGSEETACWSELGSSHGEQQTEGLPIPQLAGLSSPTSHHCSPSARAGDPTLVLWDPSSLLQDEKSAE